MLGDQVDDAFLDVRPDRGSPLRTGGRTAQVVSQLPECRHVGDGDDHLEVPLLVRRRLDDGDRSTTREEAGHLLDRPHCCGQANPLSRLVQQGIQSFETQGEMGPALGAGDRVDLVKDHCLDADEGLARL